MGLYRQHRAPPVVDDEHPRRIQPELVEPQCLRHERQHRPMGAQHRSFVGLLTDAISDRTPSLDIEGARLAALSIKQALSGTTVSLGAGGPKTILSLFR